MKELTRSEGRSIDSECDICRELQNPKEGWFFREVGSRLGVTRSLVRDSNSRLLDSGLSAACLYGA